MANQGPTLPTLLLVLLTLLVRVYASDSQVDTQYSIATGLCPSAGPLTEAPSVQSNIECAAECLRDKECFACCTSESSASWKWELVQNPKIPLLPGNCKLISKEKVPEEHCVSKEIQETPFLITNITNHPDNLIELLCSHWCAQLASDGSQFIPLGSVSRATVGAGSAVLCQPLLASTFFERAASSEFSSLSVSLGWRSQFAPETLCAVTPAANVPPVILLDWAKPIQLDVCAQACVWRPTCEFFLFNASGCFEGSLSLYLNSRLKGVTGCSMWHKLRTWNSSMLAFYTFNSSLLNLADPAIMPAVNNTPIDIGPDGFLVPLYSYLYVRLNLSHIGFDTRVRAMENFTFVMSINRNTVKSRSEFVLFADCNDVNTYNGAINEQSLRNEGWFLNSLTGRWQVVKSVNDGSTYSYPSGSPFHVAMALGPNDGYFVVNGVRLSNSAQYTAASTYGTDPKSIGCLFFGMNVYSPPSRILEGRIRSLGIFSRLLSVEEIIELM